MLDTLRGRYVDPVKGKQWLTQWLQTVPVITLSTFNHYIAYAIIMGAMLSIVWSIWQIKKSIYENII
jgi:hypothetical protein